MPAELIPYIASLYAERGSRWYGEEAVTQLEHALQCAALAEADGANDSLIAASFLHDLGHLIHELGPDIARRGVDDRHEYRPVRMLRRAFPDAVITPIRLHVAAKRYLCAVRPDYHDSLSSASRLSLALQGGAFSAEEAQRFIAQPYAEDTVRLRLWDDRAKEPRKSTPGLAHYLHILQRCAHESRDPQSQA